jgi:hypothetical protein
VLGLGVIDCNVVVEAVREVMLDWLERGGLLFKPPAELLELGVTDRDVVVEVVREVILDWLERGGLLLFEPPIGTGCWRALILCHFPD